MKKENIIEAITLGESKRLITLEKTIQAGVETFVTVGCALAEIRDARLYRADHKTFEQYCHKRWQFTRVRAYQLIEAANTVKALPENVKPGFTNAKQANVLARAPKAKRTGIARVLVEKSKKTGKKITTAEVRKAVGVKPRPRGGLAAAPVVVHDAELPNPVMPDALAAKIDLAPLPEQDEIDQAEAINVKQFERKLFALECQVERACNGDQKEREKFGVIVNSMANRLMNPPKNKSVASFYTS